MLRLSVRLAALMSALFIMSSAPVFAGVPVQSLKQTGSITAPANFAALSPDESKLYVVNQVGTNFAAKLTVIDATTNTVAGSLDLGLGFVFEIALTPAGDRAYVAISKSSGSSSVSDPGRVAVVDVSQSPPVLVTTITSGLGATPSGITVDPRPTAQRAYVADRGTGRIYIIDTSSNSVLSSFPSGGSGPFGIAVTADGSRLYAANRGIPGSVPVTASAVDLTTTPPTVTTFQLDIGASGAVSQLALAPNGKRAYITSNLAAESRIQVIGTDPADGATFNKKLGLISTPGNTLEGIAFTSDGQYAYVASQGTAEVVVVNATSETVERRIGVGGPPLGVVSRSALGAKAYVGTGSRVAVIGTDSPTVAVGPNGSGDEGAPIGLNGTVTDGDSPNVDKQWTYAAGAGTTGTCSFGDATSADTTIICTDNGSYTATLTARDGDNPPVARSVTVTVANVKPTATLSAPASVNEGGPIPLTLGAVSDAAGDLPTLQFAFDCGDGHGYGPFGSAASAACPTTDNGTRSVKAKVKDKDGGENEYQAVVEVKNVAPTATFNAPASANEGTTFTLSLTGAQDASSVDAASPTYAFDCGTGTLAPAAGSSITCPAPTTNAGGASLTVRGQISDKDGGKTAYTATVSVTDVMPTSPDQCKSNGWTAFLNADGSRTFKNQGDCVSWVQTGGSNAPAGR